MANIKNPEQHHTWSTSYLINIIIDQDHSWSSSGGATSDHAPADLQRRARGNPDLYARIPQQVKDENFSLSTNGDNQIIKMEI